MPTYVYECPEHGQFDIVKPMADSGREELCVALVEPVEETGYDPQCGRLMTRVFTASSIITNPSGDGYFFNKATGLRSSGKGKR